MKTFVCSLSMKPNPIEQNILVIRLKVRLKEEVQYVLAKWDTMGIKKSSHLMNVPFGEIHLKKKINYYFQT